jgi:hypothetical protein
MQPRLPRPLFHAARIFGRVMNQGRGTTQGEITGTTEMSRMRRILLIQTQAENAGAQEISRPLGAGPTARGYEVHSLLFFRKTRSFD